MPGKHRRAVPRRRRNAVTVTSAALAAGGAELVGEGFVPVRAGAGIRHGARLRLDVCG